MTSTIQSSKPVGRAGSERIVLMRPHVPESAIAAVSDVLRSRWIGEGPKVQDFERQFSALVGRPSVAVGSCTDALHLAYILAGIGPGDEVIAPLFTCTATNIPLLYQGAKIRFCDVEPDSLNMDAKHAASLVTKRTKAIVTVHYGGMPADLLNLDFACADGHNVTLIEDCAQSLGMTWPETHRGLESGSVFQCFSFQAVKHITTGDGGMLAIHELDADRLIAKAKRIRWFGIDREAKLSGTWANDITELGFKMQMTDIAAAMGIEGMRTLSEQIDRRRLLRARYIDLLRGIGGITVLDADPFSACWLMTVLVDRREDFRRMLATHNIESDQVHYRNDRYSIFKEFRGEFPNMDAIDGKYLCLPMHMSLSIADVERVCGAIRSGW